MDGKEAIGKAFLKYLKLSPQDWKVVWKDDEPTLEKSNAS